MICSVGSEKKTHIRREFDVDRVEWKVNDRSMAAYIEYGVT